LSMRHFKTSENARISTLGKLLRLWLFSRLRTIVFVASIKFLLSPLINVFNIISLISAALTANVAIFSNEWKNLRGTMVGFVEYGTTLISSEIVVIGGVDEKKRDKIHTTFSFK